MKENKQIHYFLRLYFQLTCHFHKNGSNRLKIILIFSTVFILFSTSTNAQELSNYRTKNISISNDTLKIDTLPIIFGSLRVQDLNGQLIKPENYYVEHQKGLFIWVNKPNIEEANVMYRVYFANFFAKQSRKKVELLEKSKDIVFGKDVYKYDFKNEPIDVFDLGNLNYFGNFSRGISLGSNQDLVVNSQFNLQMQGKLKNDVMVRASINDNNIPFQAQGNTQQLQEFDRIFIEVYKDNNSVILGDYDLKRPNSYFMNFQKRLQGIKGKTAINVNDGELSATAAVAIARGEYNRMQFIGEEGNQGPYKLIGRNGENFIIILSGSERVYIDGQLLTRGFDQDYIIDYNLGEITFTPNRLITKDIRIVIEFEYSIQNYLRSLAFAETEYTKGKLRVHAHLYSEQDAKNQPLLQDLDNDKIDFLKEVGDDINNALYTGVDSVEYSENRVLYEQKDTLVNGRNYTVYQFSQNPETAQYSLAFSNVGFGNGNYIFSEAGINGRVYEWVAPDNFGNPTGNYEPVIRLISPQQRQLLTSGISYQLKNNGSVSAEIGISNKDVNTYSELNDKDDVGLAANLQWQQTLKLDTNANWQLENKANYEFVQSKFEFLENYRPIEFTRDWNVSNQSLRFHEHLSSFSTKLSRNRWGYISYNINSLVQQNNYQGFRHIAENKINRNGFSTLIRADYLHASAETENTSFFRPIINFRYQSEKTKQWAFGFNAFQEKQKVIPYEANSTQPDTLSTKSLYFNVSEIFIQSPQQKSNKLSASWQQRWDYNPEGSQFALATRANTFQFQGELNKNPKNQLRWSMSYRTLDVLKNNFNNQEDNRTLLGEINYLFEAFKGLIRSNTNYKLGSGQKQVIEYEFTPVTNSLGTHVWVDLNENNIKEIDEFRPIFENEFPDTTYIQINIPSNIYQRTNIVEFTQNLNIIPKRLWFSNESKFFKFINKWEFQSLVEVVRHFPTDTLENAGALYSPVLWGVKENIRNSIVSERTANRNALFFNRGGRPFNAELFISNNRNKELLVNGSIERNLREQGTRLKTVLNKSFSASLDAKVGNNFYASAANANSNYNIDFTEIEPSLKWQHSTKLGIELSYLFRDSENVNGEKGTHQEAAIRFRFNAAQKNAFDGRISYINMKYNGTPGENFNLDNHILQGLNVGSNYVWNLNFRTQISKHIELRLTYNGKKSEGQKMQNTGRAQVTALF